MPGETIYPPEFPMGISADLYDHFKRFAESMRVDVQQVAVIAVMATKNEYTKNTPLAHLGIRFLKEMGVKMREFEKLMPSEDEDVVELYGAEVFDMTDEEYKNELVEGWECDDCDIEAYEADSYRDEVDRLESPLEDAGRVANKTAGYAERKGREALGLLAQPGGLLLMAVGATIGFISGIKFGRK